MFRFPIMHQDSCFEKWKESMVRGNGDMFWNSILFCLETSFAFWSRNSSCHDHGMEDEIVRDWRSKLDPGWRWECSTMSLDGAHVCDPYRSSCAKVQPELFSEMGHGLSRGTMCIFKRVENMVCENGMLRFFDDGRRKSHLLWWRFRALSRQFLDHIVGGTGSYTFSKGFHGMGRCMDRWKAFGKGMCTSKVSMDSMCSSTMEHVHQWSSWNLENGTFSFSRSTRGLEHGWWCLDPCGCFWKTCHFRFWRLRCQKVFSKRGKVFKRVFKKNKKIVKL